MKIPEEIKSIVTQLEILEKTEQRLCQELIQWFENCEKEVE